MPGSSESISNEKKQSTADRDATWLRSRGWRETDAHGIWHWYKPPLRGTFYRLKDALDIERAKKP